MVEYAENIGDIKVTWHGVNEAGVYMNNLRKRGRINIYQLKKHVNKNKRNSKMEINRQNI